ncbi:MULTISPECIES: hypothetical protein [unclassified Bradyrhizobium]|uniref:hypothetical protein n=1 Tax=unclassified Bradyrhizobium TaxID=2631580 RepID=UPI002915C540|nr:MULTISPECIES: hypothetical protein [unclassified Bradyrhizobium]
MAIALTRRRALDAQQESWRVFYGDVEAGHISRCTGAPAGTDPWQWFCGFYPGSHPGERTVGTAATLEEARQAFEGAWAAFLAKRTPEDFDAYRRHVASTRWKYAMWDAGCRLPTQNTSGRSRCFCGAEIDLQTTESHIYSAHMAAPAF